jgi:hypothetical protein
VRWPAGALLLLALLSACATASRLRLLAPRNHLDENTGATVTFVGAPLVFARERTELAANARDYVTLVATLIDRNGKLQYVLVGYVWSTVDIRLDDERPDERSPITITADDRRFALTPTERSAHDVGLDLTPRPPPGPHRRGQLYLTDLPTLRFLATARDLRLQVGTSDTAASYHIWRDGRDALSLFVAPATAR